MRRSAVIEGCRRPVPVPRLRPHRRGRVPLALFALPLLSGCSAQAILRADGGSWLWGLAPLVVFAVVQGPGLALDRRRLARRGERMGGRLYLAGLAIVLAATVSFVAWNLAVEMPSEGKLANVGAWFAGAAVGAAGGALADRRAAAAASARAVGPLRGRAR
jgi:hypothetical protein